MASFLILLSDNSLQAHKLKFDDELEDLVNEIDVKYPAGLCEMHSNAQCFHYHPAHQHFILDCPKKLVWAAHIVSIGYWYLN